jgi:hypothetical protein
LRDENCLRGKQLLVMRSSHRGLLVVALTVPLAVGGTSALLVSAAGAAPAIGLGTATGYAVLGGSTVTNTGPTVISGDLGLSPGISVTGFPPGTVNGSQHVADGAAGQAQTDTTTAYNTAAGLTTTGTVTADLGGQILGGGVYSGPTLGLTGALTLDGAGDPSTVFVFRSSSTLITGTTSAVVLTGGASACNVFWQVGSSATLGVGSSLVGTVVALTSITANTGASVSGRLLARNGAVTLDTNTVSLPVCTAAVPSPSPSASASASPTPSSSPTPSASASPSAAASPTATPRRPSGSPAPVVAAPPATRAPVVVPPTTPVVSAGNAVPPATAPVPAPGPAAPQVPDAPTTDLPVTGAPTGQLGTLGLLIGVLGYALLRLGRRPRTR